MAFKRKATPTKCKQEVIVRDKLRCVKCGKELFLDSNKNQLVVADGCFHHILPLVYRGKNETFNICLLCKDCHLSVHSGDENKRKYLNNLEIFIKTGRL